MNRDRRQGEIYLEFYPVGGQVKVTAIDAATAIEVSTFGPASASQEDLKRIAVRKLKRRIEQLRAQGDLKDDPTLY
ncbi:serine hydroxymethyltransferase [Roseibium denhamense]|uniref:DUF6898 domain-containing protein n=1 Tax=Roseibium denhamense TaxID=76305 RepID=A0ABY1NVM6_9HYPH|nr:serine hydroxymethyltransferase [Roseibium denhamense]MTI04809.1 serine hydroxymethyltransferase [Roseibium denhamense]SMP19126.1 hypothetical protein SAMN06265374_2005 [Roseibium denhamense]